MTRHPVHSSNLASVGYDPLSTILEVEFLNSRIYQYVNVPRSVFNGLMNAASKGRCFNRMIVKGGFSFRRIV